MSGLYFYRFIVLVLILCKRLALTRVFILGCPTIKGRTSWGARSAKKVTRMARAAQYVVIHHTTGGQCANENACATRLKNIQAAHMSGNRNYDDIGYNFLVRLYTQHIQSIFELMLLIIFTYIFSHFCTHRTYILYIRI